MITKMLTDEGLIQPPKFLVGALAYETEVGSVAYGVSQRASDLDVYGFCVPPREVVFPHLAGEIPGFGRQRQRFEQFQEHGVERAEDEVVYDVTIYSIVRYVSLCMENNPNMLESLFTPDRCVLFESPVAKLLRDNRHVFLHKGAWHKFRGFAHSQLHKMTIKDPKPGSKRAALVEAHGYDVKFAYHAVRLMDEVEEILTEGTLTLDANVEKLSAIRAGEWAEQEVRDYVARREQELAPLYASSDVIPHSPDEGAIRGVMLAALEEAWGSLDGCFGA